MGVYFGTTEITGLYVGDTEITGLYFGDTEIWAAWAEYDGALPAQYTANGGYLADYRIYGANEGVGDKTANLFDHTATDSENGYERGYYLCPPSISGGKYPSAPFAISEYIDIDGFAAITFSGYNTYYSPGIQNEFYDADKQRLLQFTTPTIPATINVPTSAKYMRFSIKMSVAAEIIIAPGSTAPAEYVPYGYEVDMSVSDGTTSTTTPIYIGDTKLDEDEYVSFKEQKIYRMSGGVLTPTDPPVPLPALPTCEGSTITDYAGQSAAPSRFYAKYRKG